MAADLCKVFMACTLDSILAAWAVVITAFEVALIVFGPDRGLGCFK
jgi:hypothetical protein